MNSIEVDQTPARQDVFDISSETIQKAAAAKYGKGVLVSAPYWLDSETLRVGISTDQGNMSFGANFYYREGVFH